MTARILIIEDEALVAMELRFVLEDLGHEVVGMAADARTARHLASETEVDLALVDIHLSDGPTGVDLGRELGQDLGVTVLFMTANPSQLGDGVPGTVGVLPKPVTDRELRAAVAYAVARRDAAEATPPQRLKLFSWSGATATAN